MRNKPKISILGGDLSTFEVNDYYGGECSCWTGVEKISDTYWYMVVDNIGELLSNVSYSDKLISDYNDSDINHLARDGIKPDIVIVNLGIEDALAETDINIFSEKYDDIIIKIKRINRKAEIWCLTIPQTLVPPKFKTPSFDDKEYVCVLPAPIKRSVEKYNECIESFESYRVKIIQIGNSLSFGKDMGIGDKLKKSGMQKIADDICKFAYKKKKFRGGV